MLLLLSCKAMLSMSLNYLAIYLSVVLLFILLLGFLFLYFCFVLLFVDCYGLFLLIIRVLLWVATGPGCYTPITTHTIFKILAKPWTCN